MFRSARIKLTAWYLAIIMTITMIFSTVVYVGVSSATQRAVDMHERRVSMRLNEFGRFQNMPPRFQEPINIETVKEVRSKTLLLLVAVNAVIMIISGLLGYILAGQTLRPIERMTEKQKKFIADAAHELKTPLTAIKTNLEVTLRNKKLDTDIAKKIIEETLEDIDSLTYLTESLIKQSKYENLGKGNGYQFFDLSESIEHVQKKLATKIKEKNLTLTTELKKLKISADKTGITELVTILLDNAIKFNKKNGEIKVETKRDNDCAIIKISDTGPGISKEDLPHVFDRFYKSDLARTGHEGFGLGLSIAKEIATNHKGKIYIEKTSSKGTSIVVTLPIIKSS